MNKLILQDNLEALKSMDKESVDLVYLDPPFFSNRNYAVVWGDDGEIRSFKDIWEGGMDTYISFLKERVEQMYRILKPTGSLYLHCDWHASAYIKTEILDKIFGYNNFRNEIIWSYRRWTAGTTFQRMHDTIYFYTKSSDFTFHKVSVEPTEGQKAKQEKGWDRNSVIIDGKRQPQLLIYNQDKVDEAVASGKIKLEEFARVHYLGETNTTASDVWDINILNSQSKERIGYPTQKPEALLERIILASSNEGDVVLDPFVGGGTTIAVADRLNRKWIGIDQSAQAISVTKLRLAKQRHLFSQDFVVVLGKYVYSEIRNMDDFEFQTFIIEKYDGIPNTKKVGDLGIDGKMPDGTPIQVKRSDKVGRDVIDKFLSAVKRNDERLYNQNIKKAQPVGYIIAFSFARGAVAEVARLKNENNIILKLVKVNDIIPIVNKPLLSLKLNILAHGDDGYREVELLADASSEAGINFYSWDFDFHTEKGFIPYIMRDFDGKQKHTFSPLTHNIAVKVFDNYGIENMVVEQLEESNIANKKRK